jgi:hypothetical protein
VAVFNIVLMIAMLLYAYHKFRSCETFSFLMLSVRVSVDREPKDPKTIDRGRGRGHHLWALSLSESRFQI